MADRGLSASALTELAASEVGFYHLVRMDFSTPIYHTTGPHDITYDSNTYISNAVIDGIPGISETLKIKPNTISLKLGGALLSVHSLMLGNYKNAGVYIYRYLVSTGETVLIFKGFIDGFTSTENAKGGKSTVTLKVANHWADWESKGGRLLSDENQQSLYSGDTGLEYASITDKVMSYWGDFQGFSTTREYRTRIDNFRANPPAGYPESALNQPYPVLDWFTPAEYGADTISVGTLPVVYGQWPVKGIPVFRDVELSGDNLWVVYALSEGVCDSIVDVTFDGVSYTDASISGYVSIPGSQFHDGSTGQFVDTNLSVASPVDWDSTHRLRGICYIVVKYVYNEDIWRGEPEPVFILKGKECYNPVTTVTEWTDNPAIILYDYLTSTEYGKGLAAADLDNFTASSINYCAALQTDHDNGLGGGTTSISRFSFNGAIDTTKTIKENVEVILFSMIGYLPWISGKYKLVIERNDDTAQYSFDEDNVSGAFTVEEAGTNGRANAVYYTYSDSLTDYSEATTSTVLSSGTITTEDYGKILRKNVKNRSEINRYRAKNRSNTILKQSRDQLAVTIECGKADCLQVETGDVIDITRATQSWAAKLFRVREMLLNPSGDCTFKLLEYDATNFDWTVNAEEEQPVIASLTDPFTVTAPTSLVLTSGTANQITYEDLTAKNRIKVSFTASTSELEVNYYIIEYKESSDTDYTRLPDLYGRTNTVCYIDNVTFGVDYDVRVFAVNGLGIRSSQLLNNHVVGGVPNVGYENGLIGTDDYLSNTFFWHLTFESIDGFVLLNAVVTNSTAIMTAAAGGAIGYIDRQFSKGLVTLSHSNDWKLKHDLLLIVALGNT